MLGVGVSVDVRDQGDALVVAGFAAIDDLQLQDTSRIGHDDRISAVVEAEVAGRGGLDEGAAEAAGGVAAAKDDDDALVIEHRAVGEDVPGADGIGQGPAAHVDGRATAIDDFNELVLRVASDTITVGIAISVVVAVGRIGVDLVDHEDRRFAGIEDAVAILIEIGIVDDFAGVSRTIAITVLLAFIGKAVAIAVRGNAISDVAFISESVAVAVIFAVVWNTVGIAVLSRAIGDFTDITDSIAVTVGLIGVGVVRAVVAGVADAVIVAVASGAVIGFTGGICEQVEAAYDPDSGSIGTSICMCRHIDIVWSDGDVGVERVACGWIRANEAHGIRD